MSLDYAPRRPIIQESVGAAFLTERKRRKPVQTFSSGEKVNKKTSMTTDLFKGKNIPDFIKNHSLFRNPVKVTKVFPSIGLPNFREKVNVDKCLVDVKKEGTYVHNLLRVMVDIVGAARDGLAHQADRLQYLDAKDVREKDRTRLNEFYNLSNILANLGGCVDPYNKDVLTGAIQTADGKIALKLMKDIADNNDKVIFRKDESLFKIFNKVKDKCTAVGVGFTNLEQADAFKIFSKENIPNKEFSIYFSAEGEEGAWDIATMSMRGIKSCQRWDGEYPRCLIGSILSKFVGIMYLTSGVQSDTNAGFANLGTKMMRRCVVRYAVDADENKPCILLDKMYPELDKDILGVFVNAIKSRTDLPVYYSQDLGNKIRHIYLPAEKIREEILDREWSYQDTPLKSKHDLNVYLLTHNKEEVEREIKGFKLNLALFLARRMEAVYSEDAQVSDPEVKKTISNIRMNTSFTPFCETAATYIINGFRAPLSKGFTNSRSFYRKYLMELLLKRKAVLASCLPNLNSVLSQNTSRTVDTTAFVNYLFTLVSEFARQEIAKVVN